MDPGEPGSENITVFLGNFAKVSTDRNGYFILPSFGQDRSIRVYIDIDTVPATYSPTHAIQTVNLVPGSLTEANFGITPLNSVQALFKRSGKIKRLNS